MAIIFATQTSTGAGIAFKIVRGTRWQDTIVLSDQLTGNPVDLTGVTGIVMRVRKTMRSTVLLELSVANGRLTVTDAPNGTIAIDVSSTDTNTLPTNNYRRARYLFDMEIQRSASEYEAAISGKLVVLPSVTRKLDDAV